ncbi:unnamed protein product [Dibothriocephalus latus]|uniref:EF-hand domain-containing protein n=1 Tax=Dibothriocephalus latus TaxID=60516 RepID=A0A3P7P7J5_DIBLA|nr:unnamed protein product [Dibothriocephalus latus]
MSFSETVIAMFKDLDKDGSNKVSAKELAAMLREVGSKLDMKAVERLVRKFDANGDGELSIEELNVMMEGI